MLALCVPFVFILILSSYQIAGSSDTSDQQSIHNLLKEYETAYNEGDAETISLLWASDGDLFSLSGGIFRGRDEVMTFFSKALSRNYKGSKFQMTVDQIRKLEKDIAVVDGRWEVIGKGLPKNYPTFGIFTKVLLRSNNQWRIVAARPSVPLGGHTRDHGRKKPTTETMEIK